MKLNSHGRWLSLPVLLLLAWAGQRSWTKHRQNQLCSREYAPPPPGMAFVPAGEFWMGSDAPDAEPDEHPRRKVFLRAFYIDKFEVTNRRYRELIPEHRFPPGEEDLPVTHVFKREAEEFCRRAGRRLPTGAEWEKAARGTDARLYPWGDEFMPDRANISRQTKLTNAISPDCKSPLSPSRGKVIGGSFPGGTSPYGCQDMAGNVWEWVSDEWVDPAAFGEPPTSQRRGILRGGAYSYSPRQARASYQGFEDPGTTCNDVGFRCAMDAVAKSRQPQRPGGF